MLVELLYSCSEEISIRMGLMIAWIIHLWWKSPPLSLTPIYTTLVAYLLTTRQTSSPFLGELISINFNSCNVGLKCGVRRSKLKRPRTAKVQLIFGMEEKRKNEERRREKFMNVENDWNFKRCLFDGRVILILFFLSTLSLLD